MLDSFVGSEALTADLKTALNSGRLANSLLICGDDGMGRGYLARCIAADYLYKNNADGQRNVMNDTSPECITVLGEGASGMITVKRIRQVRYEICATAVSAQGRAVVMPAAHMLNTASANALLKILEEPPEGVLFILCAKNAAAVMPTIRSRCCIYNIAPPSVNECTRYLKENGVKLSDEDIENAADIYGGRIGCCMELAESRKRLDIFKQALQLYGACENGDEYGINCLLAGYEKDKQGALCILSDAVRVFETEAKKSAENGRKKTCMQAAEAAENTQNAIFAINQNGSVKLVLCNLAAQLAFKK